MEVNDFISSSQVLENSSVDLSSSLPALINQFQQHIQEERYAALSLKECEMHPIVIKRCGIMKCRCIDFCDDVILDTASVVLFCC